MIAKQLKRLRMNGVATPNDVFDVLTKYHGHITIHSKLVQSNVGLISSSLKLPFGYL